MHLRPSLLLALLAAWLGGCATSSVKQSWKSPDFKKGQLTKVSVLAMEERSQIRQGFENRFVEALSGRGQPAIATFGLLGLAEVKSDKDAAAAKLQAQGANAVFIVRLVDQFTYSRQMRATPSLYAPSYAGIGSYGWYDYYSVAFTDMSVVWGDSTQEVYLDCSLFDLTSGRRVWSALTLSAVKEDADRLAIVDALVKKIVDTMERDGVVGK